MSPSVRDVRGVRSGHVCIGIPKWMVKIMESPIKMDDLGGLPTIFGNIP